MIQMEKLKVKLHDFIKSGEKYLKTDTVYLAKGGSWLSLGQFVSTLTAFSTSIFFANFLPKETYGTYQYIISIAGILSVTTLSGINTSFSQAVARHHEGDFYTVLKSKIRWGLIGGIGSVILGIYYFINENITLSFSFFIASVFLPIMDSFSIYGTYLQSRRLFGLSIRFFSISQIISVVALIIIGALTKNIPAMIFAYFCSITLTRYIALTLTLKKFPPNQDRDKNVLVYGKHLSLAGGVSTAANYLDRFVLFHFLGPVETAIYSLAIAPVEQLRGVYKNIPTLVIPKFAQKTLREINKIMQQRFLQLTLTGIIIMVAYLFLLPFFFKIFFPKYPESIIFSQIYALTLIFRLPGIFFAGAIQSKLTSIPKPWLYWGLVPQVIFIIGLFILTPKLGIVGVLISKFILLSSSALISFTEWKILLRRNI